MGWLLQALIGALAPALFMLVIYRRIQLRLDQSEKAIDQLMMVKEALEREEGAKEKPAEEINTSQEEKEVTIPPADFPNAYIVTKRAGRSRYFR